MAGVNRPYINCIYNLIGDCEHKDNRKKFLGLIKYKPKCKPDGCKLQVKHIDLERPPKVRSAFINHRQCSYASAGKSSASTPQSAQPDDTLLYMATGAAIASSISDDSYGGGSSGGGGSSRSWESDYNSSADYSSNSDCGSFSSD
ncbi:hypothetical protein [Sporomusa malonica]|uniref:Uncharacterized protein n=1 Tax=Sporomusa malonica TaxID=112901 RepID=A0A1W2ASV9_9FIRM|nr:hypothetical protein [Sporomusa malonica]SMC63531.1 hypothetical protein SAMN04488500_10677 [Sporomusa malonica]